MGSLARSLVSSASLVGVLGLLACSGAHPQDVLGDQATQGSSTSGSSSTGGASSSGASSSGVSSSGSASGGSGTSSGGTTGCAQEQEPNDSPETANELAPSRCGTVGRKDQRDFLTFILKPTTKTFSLNFSGEVHLRVNVDGHTVDLLPNSTSVIPPFAPGKRYMIEVDPLNDNASEVKYMVSLNESP